MSSSSEKNSTVNYQSEIELLKKALAEKSKEASFYYERQSELEDSLVIYQDKFERLHKSHRKIQSINQTLEEKLLKLVDRNSGEKAQLIGDCATLNIRLNQANFNILQLQREIERYKQDITLALHLLQCNPNSFITPSIKSLPIEIQSKLTSYMRREMNNSDESNYHRIPTCDPSMSFSPPPPLSSTHGSHKNDLSPIAFLEDELKMSMKHCDTCTCCNNSSTFKELTVSTDIQRATYSVGIQTDMTAHCLRCNLNSPSHQNNNLATTTTTTAFMKKLRSSDSVFSESNLSDFTNSLMTKTPKKDDLTINPPHLAHHRMCERTKNINANVQQQQQQRRNVESVKNEQLTPQINPSPTSKLLLHRASSKDLKNEEIKSASNKARNQHASGGDASTSNDLNGTKIFENFNKDLLKSIKNKNLKILGPRICAVRIHEDKIHEFMTMDSGASDTKSIPYAYSRSRTLVDDDLIENEENGDLPLNFHSSSRSSIVMSTVEDEIFSTNKTDSEKFNEIKKELQQSSCINNNTMNINNNNNNSNNQTAEEILCEGDVASISDSVNEHAIMKHQRVAEWIQNSSQISLSPGSDAQQKLSTPTFENKNVILEKLIDIDDDDDVVVSEPLKKEANSSASIRNDEKIDLLQMEYNVKQFLLHGLTKKSSSVYRDLHFSNSDDDDEEQEEEEEEEEEDDASHYIKQPQRTETNL